jgi:hypothetical protein
MMKLMHAAISGLWRFLRASCADKHGHFLGAHIPRLGAEDLGAMIAVVSGAQTGTKCLLGDQAPPPGLLENGNKNAELGDFAAQLCFFGVYARFSSGVRNSISGVRAGEDEGVVPIEMMGRSAVVGAGLGCIWERL